MKPQVNPKLVSVFVGAFVFAAVMVFHVTTNLAAIQQQKLRLENYADQAAIAVELRARQIIERLRDVGISLRFADGQSISPTSSFHGFVRETNILDELKTISGVSFIHVFPAITQEAVFLGYDRDPKRRNLGYAPFEFPSRRDSTWRAPIVMVEPLSRDMRQIGTDVLLSPRADTLMRALADGQPKASERYRHFTGETGVAVFVPVSMEEDLTPGKGPAERTGVVATVLRAELFMRELEASLAPLGLKIEAHELGRTDQPAATPGLDTLLALSSHTKNSVHGMLLERNLILSDPDRLVRDIEFAGQNWRLAMQPVMPLMSPVKFDFVMLLALAVALMAGFLYYRIAHSAEELAHQVEIRTKDLADTAEALSEERVQAERAAQQDELTGLLNRRGMRIAFEELQSQLHPNETYAILSVDLDRFKQINDTEGHQAGDALLVAVARYLRKIVPPGSLVARFGGDEFVIALVERGHTAERIGQRFLDWSRQPQMVEGIKLRFGACLGIAFAKGNERRLNEVLSNADIALYAAKDGGRDQLCIFDQEMRKRAVATKSLADDLKRALDEDEFVPFFQTQHDAVTHELRGLETLVRWDHPQRGILPPGVFLGVAESSGLLHEIDRRTMHKAACALQSMENAGLHIPKFSVNISFDRLQDPDLRQSLEALPNLNAKISFEILEAVFLDEIEDEMIWQIDRLKESGVQIEVDDFGSGRASIIALTRLAPHRLKIDRGLVQPLFTSPGQERLLSSIVDMGRALDIGVTAEGVETAAHGEFLRDIGVDTLQGFHFSKPMPASEVDLMIRDKVA